jgi:hypothetical protein
MARMVSRVALVNVARQPASGEDVGRALPTAPRSVQWDTFFRQHVQTL